MNTITTASCGTSNANHAYDYFETGPNQVLCKVVGLDQDSFPEEFQDAWDLDHVRLPCSNRIYPSDVSMWPEIVRSLSEPILTSQQLSEVMLRWNRAKQTGWNINALDAFLNKRSAEEESNHVQGTHSDGMLDQSEMNAQAALDSDEYGSNISESEYYGRQEGGYHQYQDRKEDQQQGHHSGSIAASSGSTPLKSQFLSREERQYFFDVTLPRMQTLALRLPELIKKPIPYLKQQQDSAVTLSQEQIACLLANAFFNTFPCRNSPYKRGRKKKLALKRGNSEASVDQSQQHEQVEQDEDDEDSEDSEEERHPKGKHSKRGGGSARGGRGGGSGGRGVRGGRGGGAGQQQNHSRGGGSRKFLSGPRPPRKRRATGPAAQFEFFEDAGEELSAGVKNLTVKEGNVEASSATEEVRGWTPKMPSINFISLFWTGEGRAPCTTTQAAKLRCILHYFDRVTTEMPQGTVTFHRQVLKKPAYLNPREMVSQEGFSFSKVTVDSITPIEEAPQGALQLDFANRNLGGGALENGAVQEEIRFMVCPELIVSRLFTQQLEPNEAVLIKGAERYSNHVGYSKSFEWFSDHRDPTPRDKLGRRMTEICAIDARPFKSRISRLEQFERHYVLREINKALVGFRVSPINASEWGLTRKDEPLSTSTTINRPIATGNWGCGAFGGHLQLKFVLQWIAASMCGSFSLVDQRPRDELLYYTFGMHQLKDEIEAFVETVELMDK
ncbi:hypothetical protein BGZ65_011934, partial [Modicella reniformis]